MKSINTRNDRRKCLRSLRFERLDHRQVLAGDIDLISEAVTPTTWDYGTEVLKNRTNAEGSSLPDLVGFAKALRDAGVIYYGAAWSQATTEQTQLFEDGALFLPFVEVTNANRTINDAGRLEGVQTFPTWRFPDGSRATGIQSLAVLSQRSGVAIPTADRARFATVGNQSVASGSPVLLPIDVYDPEGGAVVVTVSVEDPTLLEATVLTGNRSVRFDLNGYGDMVFQILENEAPRPASRFLELASSNFYDDIIFHRVIDEFVIQGGDPLGNGTGGSTRGTFDDQFDADLQHNRKGLLSYAKSSDDTNDSQFFITADETRTLDFNHSIFGVLVEGDDVRNAITRLGSFDDKGTNASDKPLIDVTIKSVDVFTDTENAVVKLKAIGNRTGTTNLTITSTDARGLIHTEVIAVQVIADSGFGSNSQPFLNEILVPNNLPNNAPVEVQLTGVDVEGDLVQYTASLLSDGVSGTLTPNGLLTIRADDGFVGKAFVGVGIRPANGVAGALSGQSDTQRLTFNFVAVNPPTLPIPTSIDLVESSDSGLSNSDNITNADTLVFTVDGVQAGNQVRLFADGLEIGRGVATGATIEISASLPSLLGEGVFLITAAQFLNGQSSSFSTALNLTYDTTLPNPVKVFPSLAGTNEPVIADLSHPEESRDLRYSFANAPANATIDPVTGAINWTPSETQLGSQTFSLVLTDGAGNARTESFPVLVANGPVAGFRLEVANLAGNVVSRVATDEEFLLRLYARDLRGGALRQGVFSAYADVGFDASLVAAVDTALIEFGVNFAGTPSGSFSPGLIGDLGATSNVFDATNVSEVLVASARMRTANPGLVTFAASPADGADRKTSLFGVGSSLSDAFIQEAQIDLVIGETHDFGDAPSRYPVTLARDGARHAISRLVLGSAINTEADGQPSDNALSDAGDDGVVALSTIVSTTVATRASFSVSSTGPGKIDGWIDFNNDGDWLDEGEQVFVSRDVVTGLSRFSISVPGGITEGIIGARFRLSSAGALSSTGAAADGEVEDYLLPIVIGTPTTQVKIDVPQGTSTVSTANDDLIVRQGEVVLFQAPLATVGDLRLSGSSLDDILELAIQTALINGTLRIEGGLGKDLLSAIGEGQKLDLTSVAISISDVEAIDLRGTGDNELVISIDAVKSASSSTDTLQLRSDFGDKIEFGSGWAVQSPAFVDGQFVHVLSESQVGGTARIELQNDRMFQNPLNRFDADRNGSIQPLDALRIINELSRRGTGPVQLPTNDGEISRVYFDVSGDNRLTALDALRIINAIARINRGGEPEGEAVPVLGAEGTTSQSFSLKTVQETTVEPQLFGSVLPRVSPEPEFAYFVYSSKLPDSELAKYRSTAPSNQAAELGLLSDQTRR